MPVRDGFGNGDDLYTVVFQLLFIYNSIILIPGKTVMLIDKDVLKFVLFCVSSISRQKKRNIRASEF